MHLIGTTHKRSRSFSLQPYTACVTCRQPPYTAGVPMAEIQSVKRNSSARKPERCIEDFDLVSQVTEKVFVKQNKEAPKVVNFGASK